MAFIPPFGVNYPPASNAGDLQGGVGAVAVKPPFIPLNNTAKVSMRMVQDGQDIENIFYFHQAVGNFTYAQLVTMTNSILTHWTAQLVPITNTATGLTMIRAEDASNQTGPVVEYTIDPIIYGTSVGETAPATLCVGIATKTGLKGRSLNGRIFTAGRLAADFVLGIPIDATRTSVLAAYGNFVLGVQTDTGSTLGVASFRHAGLWRTIGQLTTVAALDVGEYIYTMRRRLAGHNRHR